MGVFGMDERTLHGKHCTCPMCEGRGRFRCDDKEGRGTYFCSGCGANNEVALPIGITGPYSRDVAHEVERSASSVEPSASKVVFSNDGELKVLRRALKEWKPIERGMLLPG